MLLWIVHFKWSMLFRLTKLFYWFKTKGNLRSPKGYSTFLNNLLKVTTEFSTVDAYWWISIFKQINVLDLMVNVITIRSTLKFLKLCFKLKSFIFIFKEKFHYFIGLGPKVTSGLLIGVRGKVTPSLPTVITSGELISIFKNT